MRAEGIAGCHGGHHHGRRTIVSGDVCNAVGQCVPSSEVPESERALGRVTMGRAGSYRRRVDVRPRERHAELPLADFADALGTPLGTMEDWLRAPRPEAEEPDASEGAGPTEPDARPAQIETVLAAWRAWSGSFGAFREHVRRDHRVELGDALLDVFR